MQMGINNFSASDVINKLNVKELEKIFKFFGEEKDAKTIANIIVRERKTKKINTQILVALIEKSLGLKANIIHADIQPGDVEKTFADIEMLDFHNLKKLLPPLR